MGEIMLARIDLRVLVALVVLSIFGGSSRSEATVITYGVFAVAGNTFEYRYVVDNDTLGVDIDEFAVYFDVNLFENLRMPVAPADWDPLVVQPDTVLWDDGFLDVLALASGIAPQSNAGGRQRLSDTRSRVLLARQFQINRVQDGKDVERAHPTRESRLHRPAASVLESLP